MADNARLDKPNTPADKAATMTAEEKGFARIALEAREIKALKEEFRGAPVTDDLVDFLMITGGRLMIENAEAVRHIAIKHGA